MKYILYGKATFGQPEIKAVNAVLKNGWLSGGEQTAKFEEELAKWFGVKYAIAVNSGSCANFIALQSLGLPKGSEVITCALAFPTTVSPIYYHGLIPVFIDVDAAKNLYTIEVCQLERAISKKTKAIMFAHTLGNMCVMNLVMEIAREHKLAVIEDTCDAVGSKWRGQLAGTFGDLGTISFYPSHHMTTGGEGGAILTNDDNLNRKCRSIRDWGRACYCKYNEKNINGACGHRLDNPPFDHRYFYINLGLNMKMTEMQAAFGREQLKRLDGFIEKRKKNYNYLYTKLYKPERVFDLPGMTDFPAPFREDHEISWFAFPYLAPEGKKMEMIRYLEKNGIQTRTIFAGNITSHPAYKNLPKRIIGDLESTKEIMRRAFFVGIGPKMTFKDLDYIAEKINEYLNEF